MQKELMEIDVEKEKKTLLNMYSALLRKAKPYLKEGDTKLIKKAFQFAVEAHKDMRRKSGEPFVYHPLQVAMIVVSEIGLGTTSIIAALLHDVVEDTEYDHKDIEERFNKKVARIVEGLTKISATATIGRSIQAENFRKMLLTISEDIRVVLIKIADRLHNMRTLDSMPKDKQLKIKSETEYIYAPLAHRLGLYNIKSELEDLCLKYTDTEAYNHIINKIEETGPARQRFTRSFIRPIETELKKQGFDFTIKARIKSIRSIYDKMRKQNISFEEVYDLFAIRIIADVPREEEKSACWRIYSIVTDYYTPNVNRLRDWITVPKSNGYESLHTTVMSHKGQWVEVQVRTKRMDEIAEKGYAAHWKYKNKGANVEQDLERWLGRIREMLENNDISSIEFLDDFRANLFNKEVFAFTPKGDLKFFPVKATVLDFAFDIHTEVGARCLGAKVNGKLVPLNYQLQNGDQIEILTSNKPKANEGWLKYVVTTKAKAKIKEYLKEDRKRAVTMGKEVVTRKLRQLKLTINDAIVHEMAEYFNIKSESELYFRVGTGQLDHTSLKKFRDVKKTSQDQARDRHVNGTENNQIESLKPVKKENELVIGDEVNEFEYAMAPCCNPLPGDEIFGFITISNGIRVHRTNCPNAVSLMANYGYRIIKARWALKKGEEYNADITITGTDRVGLVNDVTRVISGQMKVNMKSIAIKANNNIFEGSIQLSVHDKTEVEHLIQKLEDIEGVVSVLRTERA